MDILDMDILDMIMDMPVSALLFGHLHLLPNCSRLAQAAVVVTVLRPRRPMKRAIERGMTRAPRVLVLAVLRVGLGLIRRGEEVGY
jgi:hypothetical protein